MRVAALAGLLACVIIMNVDSPKVSAEEPGSLSLGSSTSVEPAKSVLIALESIEANNKEQDQIPTENIMVETEVTHTVTRNETLSDIAKKYETSWQRIYAKNATIDNPDNITAGDILIIPKADENLTERELPIAPPEHAERPLVQQATPQIAIQRGSSSGNTYARGWCTWYAKNRRGDLPNNLGNANTWVSRARAQGIPTGSTPQVGAIGQQGMHVVYVESINADGTIVVSEMNYAGFNVISTRTVAASSFQYIY